MSEGWMLAAALLCSLCGMGWIALAMDTHWEQAKGSGSTPGGTTVKTLRVAGAAALFVSLLLCLRADHPSMAALVWVMSLAGAALVVAMLLAWRPRWLGSLAPWARG